MKRVSDQAMAYLRARAEAAKGLDDESLAQVARCTDSAIELLGPPVRDLVRGKAAWAKIAWEAALSLAVVANAALPTEDVDQSRRRK